MKRTVRGVAGAAVLLLAASVCAAEQIPVKWIGKWKGVAGKLEGSDAGQTGTAITKRDLGDIIEEFEFDVKEDGSIQGKGKAKYWFNVSAQADLLVTKVGPSAYLEGGAQVRNFTIAGTIKPNGRITLDGTPSQDLVLINAGKRTTMGAWNVFGPHEYPVFEENCSPVAGGTSIINGPPILMKIEWKARRACRVDCEVDRNEPFGSSAPRPGNVQKVILHCTGGLDDENCDLSRSYKSGTLNGIVQEFKNAETRHNDDPVKNKKKSIHYIVGRDGTVVRMVPEDRIAYHNYTGNEQYIGIELINNGDGNDPYKDEQLDAVAKLVAEILRCHGLTSQAVVGHKDIDTRMNNKCVPPQRRRTDPGPNFPWPDFRARVDAYLARD